MACTLHLQVLFIFVAIFRLDRVGRRPLLLLSGLGMAAAHVVVAINYLAGTSVYVALFGLSLFMAAFSSGYGPTAWVLAAEIFPLSHRGAGMGAATFANRFTSGVVAISFLSLQRALTAPGIFFAFAGLALVSVVFTYVCVPETKGKTLEVSVWVQEG